MRHGILAALAVLPAVALPAADLSLPPERVTAIAAAVPEHAPARPKRPRKVLVFTRNEGFKHATIPHGAKAVELMGEKTGAFETVVSEDLGLFTPAGLSAFDAIFFDNGYKFRLDESAREALMDFVQQGKGIAGIHAASANFEGWPQGVQLFGCKFKHHPWTPKAAWAVKNLDPDHPLNAPFGGTGFRVRDEIYAFTGFDRRRERVLLALDLGDPVTAAVKHEEKFVPISWIHRLGRGRVFFCSLGHTPEVFETPALMAHLLAGIQFALGNLAADAAPNPNAAADLVASIDAVCAAFTTHRQGALAPLRLALEEHIRRAGTDSERLAAIEQQMLAVVRTAESADARREMLKVLSHIASESSVPVVAPLLAAPSLSHMARTVLERVNTPAARQALREAAGRTAGTVRVGLINSLANLRDEESLRLFAQSAVSDDEVLASAALGALGRSGTPAAANVLLSLTPRPALLSSFTDAAALCAESLRRSGRRDLAERLFLRLAGERMPLPSRIAGLRGAVTCGKRGRALALAALEGKDPVLQRAAAQVAGRWVDTESAPRVMAAYARLSTPARAALWTSLAAVTDPPSSLTVLCAEAAGSADAGVRMSALSYLGRHGGAAAVPVLAGVAAADDRTAAEQAMRHLVRLRGEDIEQALLAHARQGAVAERVVCIRALADRGAKTVTADLVSLIADTEPQVAAAALRALGRLGGPEQRAPVVSRLLRGGDQQVTAAAAEALAGICTRMADAETALAPVLAAFSAADAGAQSALLPVLARVGGEGAFTTMARALQSESVDVRRAAATAFAERWEDARPLPLLWRTARADADETVRALAMRGYLRLVGRDAATDPQQTVARLRQVFETSTRVQDRRLALSILRQCRVPAAVELAAACLDDETVRAEAMATVQALTRREKKLPAVTSPEAVAALRKVRRLQGESLPDPWTGIDIGAVSQAGQASFAQGVFTIIADGADIWGNADGGYFLFQPLRGDGAITARIASMTNTNVWAKAGVMFRASLEAEAVNVFMGVSAANTATFQRRAAAGGASQYTPSRERANPPYWVRLERSGDLFTGSVSRDGEKWERVGAVQVELPADALVGIAVTSHNRSQTTRVVADHVAVEQ